jgi:hypothetical protein
VSQLAVVLPPACAVVFGVLTDLAFAEGLVGGGRHSSAGGGWLIKEGDEGGESWREMGASVWRGECAHTILAVYGGSCSMVVVRE